MITDDHLFNNEKKTENFSITSLLEYIFVFLSVLQTGSVFIRTTGSLPRIITVGFMIISIILIFDYLTLIKNKNIFFDNVLLLKLLVYYGIFIIVFFTFNSLVFHFSFQYFTKFAVTPEILILLLYLGIKLNKNILIKLRNIIIILSVISLVFWIYSEIGIPPTCSLDVIWGSLFSDHGYYFLHFLSQEPVNFLGLVFWRNTGIFVEAPMYSYVLSIGLLINLFLIKKNVFSFSTLVLLFTIFTTTSTTGLIVSVLAIVYYKYITMNKLPLRSKKIIFIFAGVLATIVVLIVLMNKQKAMGSSVSVRSDDFFAGFHAWLSHPIFGNGMNNYQAIVNNMSPSRLVPGGNKGFSTGLMMILAYGGIYLSIPYVGSVIVSFFENKYLFGLALFSFILFVFTIVGDSYIYMVILVYIYLKFLMKMEKLNYD